MRAIRHIVGKSSVLVLVMAGSLAEAADAQGIPYASPPIRGKIVSAETRRPLAGVSVLAWWRDSRDPDSPFMLARTLRAVEAESASDGAFTIGAWTPGVLLAPVSKNSPEVAFFVTGYEPIVVQKARIRSDDRPTEIRMHAMTGPPQERAKRLTELLKLLLLIWTPLHEQATPRMLDALDAEWHRLPEESRSKIPALRPWFESAVRDLRSAPEGPER